MTEAFPGRAEPERLGKVLLITALFLVLLKLWLVSAQTVQAIGVASHDDWLFLRLASALLTGQWLGQYNELTLAKGPFYSMFIASSFILGLPLFTAQHLLYAGACGLLVRAFGPLIPHRGVRFGLFAALLFNPVTFDASVHLRLLRQNLTPALSLLIIAGLVGLHTTRPQPARLVPWAFLLGGSASAFFLAREDSLWMLPCFSLLWITTAGKLWRERGTDRAARLAIAAIPIILLASSAALVGALNWLHYGAFTTCEFRHPSFKAAYGALVRVRGADWHPFVPVPTDARERIYAVSPAFAALRPYLEGEVGDRWAAISHAHLRSPPEGREISGGWFVWALREAVAAAGYAHNAGEAMSFYGRLAREVDAAAERGELDASGSRSGFLPPLRIEYLDSFLSGIGKSLTSIVGFSGLDVTPPASIGPHHALVLYRDLTRERVSPLAGESSLLFHQSVLDLVRLPILHGISRNYQRLGPTAAILTLLAWIAVLVIAIRNRVLSYFCVLGAGLLASCMALVAGVTLIDITSFPAIVPAYFTGAYGFYVLFVFVTGLALYESLGDTRVSR